MKKSFLLILGLILSVSFIKAEQWLNLLTSQQINEIEVFNDDLYIATWGGFFVYGMNTGELKQHVKTEGFLSNKIEDVEVLAANDIWIGTYDNGVAHFDGSVWTNYPFPTSQSFNQTLLYNIEVYEGNVYAATNAGLMKLDQGQFEVLHQNVVWDLSIGSDGVLYLASFIPAYLDGDTVVQYTDCPIFSYGNGNVMQDANKLYFSGNGHIAVLENGTWKEMPIYNGSFVSDGTALAIDDNHQLWVNHPSQGLYKLVNDTLVLTYPSTQLTPNFNYEFGTALCFLNDKMIIGDRNELTFIQNGNITDVDISQHYLNNNYFQNLIYSNDKFYVKNDVNMLEFNPQNFQANSLPALSNTADYLLWEPVYSSFNDELGYFNKASGQLFYKGNMQQVFDPNLINFSYNIIDALIDKNDALWVGTYQGLYEFSNGSYTKYDTSDLEFESQYFGCIAEDNEGNVWVGSANEVAMRDGNTWTNVYHADDLNYIFGGAGLNMTFDVNNTLYYACWANGVAILENGVWTNINMQNSGLSDNMVSDVLINDGLIYFATYSGLDVFDGQDFVNFNRTNSGLSDDQCLGLELDLNGNLWISTANGISVYNKDGLALSVKENLKSSIEIKAYPNPSFHQLNLSSEVAMLGLQLFNIKGELVRTLNLEKTFNAKINVAELNKGIYFLRIETAEGSYTEKLQIGR